MEKIEITKGMTGMLVYAKSKLYLNRNWLILISHIEYRDNKFYIKRHLSVRLDRDDAYGKGEQLYIDAHSLKIEGWGFTTGYDFFKPTDEHKQLIMSKLKKMRIKFIPVLNKLVKV